MRFLLVLALMNYTWSGTAPENPISDGGKWNTTMPASWTTNVKTASGPPNRINGPDSSGSNDSVAALLGTWGANQTVTGTVFVGGAYGAAEIELHLMMVINVGANTITTYEMDYVSSLGATGTLFIAKWLGIQGNVTVLNNGGSGDPMVQVFANNDTIKATITGPGTARVITGFQNGTQIAQVTDTSGYTSGNPGVGFDAGTVANGNNLGLKAYTASDGLGGTPMRRNANLDGISSSGGFFSDQLGAKQAREFARYKREWKRVNYGLMVPKRTIFLPECRA